MKKAVPDKRIRTTIFPLSVFVLTFLIFGLFTTIQMTIIGDYIDYERLPAGRQAAVLIVWALSAGAFTLLTRYQINNRYQKPMETFAEAARQVANGDFSVYVPPRHTADKQDHLDVIFSDFNTMVEELGSMETLKTDFLSNVSHEIRTPLAVIQNHAMLLQKDALSGEQQTHTDAILQAVGRLSGLMTNMLRLNKLEKQAIRPRPERYDLCRQLCDCALQFEEIWEKKQIVFTAELEDCAMIEADEGLLELVWNNLLSNAFKFTPPNGTVTLRQTAAADTLEITVADTGCGIAPEVLPHIFDKFYQGDASHASEGNGLGLALARRILQLSDGTIAATSETGVGTVFTVRLPVSPLAEQEASV